MATLYIGLNQSMSKAQHLITAELTHREVTSVKVDQKLGRMIIQYRRRDMADMVS